jgi:Raf kinase inhibitor-like YbhB/YbcL family protein
MIPRLGLWLCWAISCFALTPAAATPPTFSLTSPAFLPGQPIPDQFALAHENLSPPLHIDGIPPQAKSLALVIEDPDAPSGLFIHWVLWNIPPTTTTLNKGQVPPGALQGKNSHGDLRYDGPSPPSGTHRYFFRLFAVSTLLTLPPGADRATLLAALRGHIVGTATLMGTYAAGR